MADKQISDLTSASALTDGSLFVLEQAGAAMNANWGMIKNYISPGVAPQYSSSATYNAGDYVIYNGQLYRCQTPITTAESWTPGKWKSVTIGNELSGLKNNFDLNAPFNCVKEYAVSSFPVGRIIQNIWLNTNGREEAYNGWSSTDFLKFKSGHTVIGIYTTVKTDWVWFYDATKTPISRATADYY